MSSDTVQIALTREDVKRVLTCIEIARTSWYRILRMEPGPPTPHDAVRDAIAEQLAAQREVGDERAKGRV
ncbi:MAG: hypothetical protein KC442_11665 [Thermomicrobiales bacterium]|nr:hypothetical protein [Thermomicrobiales bacterium]